MTTLLTGARQNGRGREPDGRPYGGQPPEGEVTPAGNWFARHPGWPVTAYLMFYPFWWFLGVSDYMPILLAFPIIRTMYRWRAYRERPIKVPPGFGLWLMFMIVMLLSVLAIGQTAPQTIASPVSNRLVSYALRSADYIGVTAVFLYMGNLTEAEFPRRKLAWLLGLVGIYGIAGGWLGIVDSRFSFTSPLAYLIPQSLQNGNAQLAILLHPGSAQIQTLLGYAEGRPKAPFDYTNMWGNALAILVPWVIVVWWSYARNRRQRRWCVALIALAIPPVLYSLDRGLWVGIACSLVYLAVRLAARGKLAMLGAFAALLAIAGIVLVATPADNLIASRLQHGKSNAVRGSLSSLAFNAAKASPILGYGDTRHELGSVNSIAVGRTQNCKSCGSRSLGGNGQLWMLLVTTGLLGTGLYLAFFAQAAWRYRRDKTPYGMAGVLVILLSYVFMITYQYVGPPISFTLLAYVLLWRNDMAMRQEQAGLAAGPDSQAGAGRPGRSLAGEAGGGPRVITAGAT